MKPPNHPKGLGAFGLEVVFVFLVLEVLFSTLSIFFVEGRCSRCPKKDSQTCPGSEETKSLTNMSLGSDFLKRNSAPPPLSVLLLHLRWKAGFASFFPFGSWCAIDRARASLRTEQTGLEKSAVAKTQPYRPFIRGLSLSGGGDVRAIKSSNEFTKYNQGTG